MGISVKVPYKKNIGDYRSTQEQTAQTKELKYTLVPGETKKNYCKIMINVRTFSGDRPFNLDYLKKLIMTYAKKRIEKQYSAGVRSLRDSISEDEANSKINELMQQGYLQYVTTQYKDKLHPNVPENGIKYYIFNKFKVIECQESKYFQQKVRKEAIKIETKGKLPEKRCRALRQIYAQFGDKVPFTYEMIRSMPDFYKGLGTGKIAIEGRQKPDEKTKQYYLAAAQHAESKDIDFIDTWNSLIRNNYLIPFQYRAKDGTIKTRDGAYKVNMVFVRRCLSEIQ